MLLLLSVLSGCGNTTSADPAPNFAGWQDLATTPSPAPDVTTPEEDVAEDTSTMTEPDQVSSGDTTPVEDTVVSEDTVPDMMEPPRQVLSPEARVIYLVLPDRFANGSTANDTAGADNCFDPNDLRLFHGGDLAGLQQRLDYLETLGVNTVWTTPLYRQVGRIGDACGYHGYWANFQSPNDGALEPYLGDADDFNALLDAMHRRRIDLVLDMVVNHAGYNALLTRQKPTWFHGLSLIHISEPTRPY